MPMSGKSSKNLLSCALSRKLSGLVRLSNLETWESPGVSMDLGAWRKRIATGSPEGTTTREKPISWEFCSLFLSLCFDEAWRSRCCEARLDVGVSSSLFSTLWSAWIQDTSWDSGSQSSVCTGGTAVCRGVHVVWHDVACEFHMSYFRIILLPQTILSSRCKKLFCFYGWEWPWHYCL